ncbi:helix-turn-helix transcriptional regulator [Cohnella sp.]|uniref:helix-turn-helix transcriptional regulator n=1 Tax=Cohnella sp. TaxID=1883426 RepID=UPI00370424E7
MKQIIQSRNVHGYFDGLADLYGSNTVTRDEQRIVLPPLVGEGAIARMKIRPGVEVVASDMTLEEDWQLCIEEDKLFEITYCFSGRSEGYLKGCHFITREQAGSAYSVEDSEVRVSIDSKTRHQCLEIRMTPEQVLDYLADDCARLESWFAQEAGKIRPIGDSLALKRAVHDLAASPYRGALKRLYMESKIMEIIVLAFEEPMRGSEPVRGTWLKKRDIERLHATKQLIVDCIENPLSLKELARAAELNESKLKKGFKELFGMTVFEYVRDRRLEKGATFILTGQMNVGEAAVAVGYSNPSNFSAAFRKKYGCKPIQYVKDRR